MTEASKPLIPLTAERSPWLRGPVRLPGDPAQTGLALILAGLARGDSIVDRPGSAPAVDAIIDALGQLGARIERVERRLHVRGTGLGAFLPAAGPIDLADAGAGGLLLIAALAAHGFTSRFVNIGADPMRGALLDFLERNGARIERNGDVLSLYPPRFPIPLDLALSGEARALIAPLLLHCALVVGRSSLHLPTGITDPAEGLLAQFGVRLAAESGDGVTRVVVEGMAPLAAQSLTIAGDPSLAVFPAVAALIAPDSEIVVESVALNHGSLALLDALVLLGGDVGIAEAREGGAGLADITARHGKLVGTTIPASLGIAPDDYAILTVAAAFAEGETIFEALGEGAHRLILTRALRANGIHCVEQRGGLMVRGKPRAPGGGKVDTQLDPKLAMSFLVLGMGADQPVTIDDGAAMSTLFPDFVSALEHVGGSFSTGAGA